MGADVKEAQSGARRKCNYQDLGIYSVYSTKGRSGGAAAGIFLSGSLQKKGKCRSLSTHFHSATMAWIMLSTLPSPSSANCITKFIPKQQRDFVFLFSWIMTFWEIGPFQLSIYCYSIRGPNISFFCLSLLWKINSSKDEQNNSYNKNYRWNNTWSARGKNSKGQIRCWVRAIQFPLLAPLNCAQ